MSTRFSDEEIEIAKSADLVLIAERLGFTPKKVGCYYTLKEMDSMRIFDRNNWYRFSRKNENGYFCGSQIEFIEEFAGLSFRDSVKYLLDFVGYERKEHISNRKNYDEIYQSQSSKYSFEKKSIEASSDNAHKGFVLPKAADTNQNICKYLNEKRCISWSVIEFFLNKGLLYESTRYSNIVFKGLDFERKVRFASMRGIKDYPDRKPYKQDVTGSDKNYGFNINNKDSDNLIVFEGAIDLMSYIDIFQDFESNMLALGMTNDKPLIRFLEEHKNIKSIALCLDNDNPGKTATAYIKEKYTSRGFDVSECLIPKEYKDINEWLVRTKLKLTSLSEERINPGLKK